MFVWTNKPQNTISEITMKASTTDLTRKSRLLQAYWKQASAHQNKTPKEYQVKITTDTRNQISILSSPSSWLISFKGTKTNKKKKCKHWCKNDKSAHFPAPKIQNYNNPNEFSN